MKAIAANLTSIFFLLVLFVVAGCDKNENENTGNVLFYTNAQAMLNCGPFDVEIYIDGSLEGIIEKPVTQESENVDCSLGNNEFVLIIEKPEGEYEFTAKLTCSENEEYRGEFTVKEDSCSVVFIDLVIDNSQSQTFDYNFIYMVLLEDDLTDTIIKQEYAIEDDRVLAEKFTNYNNPQYNHIHSFEYDENGRILKEMRGDLTFMSVEWDGNTARVYNRIEDCIGEFNFDNSMRLESYNRSGDIYLNYDEAGNIIAAASNAGTFVEYLDYDYSLVNPLSLINSITILRMDYMPHFENVFKTEKVYPYEGDDYSVPLSFYEYSWTINSDGLIETITDEKTMIYLQKFEYK
ncbi:hypothetical protein [uncultured Draconibacterium sp.]|uniref:hypothetical protein n=1 Tax=uncultured Draconibacterium sp. TaxID=1573823 RepID=UPI002AA90B45|nr:hypothetical protein [uncultured Draconibacterium sp.]